MTLQPASKCRVVPCPKCKATWPIVQAMWETTGKTRKLVCVCTRCGIQGTIKSQESTR
jgi:hypothetical protein